jgi:hypothetical protein
MTVQTINIGNQVNDGLGDDLRTAFQKVNANFSELNASLTVTASNIGITGAGVFKEKVGSDLKFKRLVPGTKIFIDELTDSIIINNQQPDSFTRIDTNIGVVLANDEPEITIQGANGAENITTSAVGNVISIDTTLPVSAVLTAFDFGPIANGFQYSTQLSLAAANIDFGTITNPGTINLDLGSF